MTEILKTDVKEGIATLTLNNGKANAISHELIEQLHAALDNAETEGNIVILAGQPGIFSGGYDLKTMQKSMKDAMGLVKAGSSLSRRLLAFPTPVIVACEGHAIAKGAFLLLSTDYRIGATGPFKIGLNEVAIGMTMHYAGIELAANRLSPNYLERSVNTAEIFTPEQAKEASFFDEITEPDNVMNRAIEVAKGYQSTLKMKAHHGTKIKLREGFLSALDEAIALDEEGTL